MSTTTPEGWARHIARWGAEYFPGNTPAGTFWQFFRGIKEVPVRNALKFHASTIISLMASAGGRKAGAMSRARAQRHREHAQKARQGMLNL